MKLFMALSLFLSFSAYSEEGFFKDPSENSHWGSFSAQNFYHSVVKLESEEGSICTGSFVSNDGYMLTAGHCLQTCLKDLSGTKNLNSGNLYDINLYDQSLLKGSVCELRVKQLGFKRAKIVFIGSGTAGFEDDHIDGISKEVRSKLSHLLDFALIKFETKTKTKCLNVATDKIMKGDEVMSIGHPGRADRKANSSNGISKYFGFGEISDSLMDNELYKEKGFSTEKILMLEEAYNLDHYFVTSADLVPGYSGGPTLNLKGEIIGVNTNVASFIDYTERYVANSAIILRATTIQKELEKFFVPDQMKSFFSCVKDN
jgi:hypothetical protein